MADKPSPTAQEGIATLPIDALALVFAFTPTRARLNCISLVCKKWRAAALRSIRSLSWPIDSLHSSERTGASFQHILALFPSLTSFNISSADSEPIALPTTLRRLHLFLRSPLVRDIVTHSFPQLTSLSLVVGSPESDEEATPLVNFIIRHSSQLTSLKVDFWHPQLDQSLAFPKLKEFALRFHAGTEFEDESASKLLAAAPHLSSVRLTIPGGNPFYIPAPLFPFITRLSGAFFAGGPIDPKTLDELRNLFQQMPWLRHMKLTRIATTPEWLDKCLATGELKTQSCLEAISNVKVLDLHRTLTWNSDAAPSSLYLPYLHSLIINQSFHSACAAVQYFLLRSPRLQEIWLHVGTIMRVEHAELVELGRKAMAHGVMLLALNGADRQSRNSNDWDFARKLGWMELKD